MTLNPDELRARAQAVAAAKKVRALEAEAKRREERDNRRQEVVKEWKPAIIQAIENSIEAAANDGRTRVDVAHEYWRFRSCEYDLYGPVVLAVGDYFRELGFEVEARAPGGKSYRSDGVGPDGYDYPEFHISWA